MATDEPQTFSVLLRRYRLAAGLTQEALAERAELSLRGVSDLERGARRAPYPDTVRRLAEAIGLSEAERTALVASSSRVGLRANARPATQPLKSALPMPLSSFVGREREVAEVQRLLGTSRLLTLTGPGGIGKTRLALEAARQASTDCADRVALVDLSALVAPELVLVKVADALGLQERNSQPLIEVLADVLRSRPFLLVLDNCEHLVGACADLAATLLPICPSLRILATSREPLGVVGEITFMVPSLEAPDPEPAMPIARALEGTAVRLFVERANAVRLDFVPTQVDAAALVDVCRRLDGIPLAIELAAARVGVLSIAQIAERLDDPFRLLVGGSRTAPARQQTLRATLEWSYELLEEPEQRVFERLSVFAGGWTLEAAEAVGAGEGVEPDAVLDLLGRLVHSSLVLAEPIDGAQRYRLLETVRHFGRGRLAVQEHADRTSHRHATFFAGLAERAADGMHGPDEGPWLDALESEHDNLRAALRWLVSRNDADAAQRLAGVLGWFWFFHGHVTEGRAWLAEVLAMPGVAVNSRGGAACNFGAALVAIAQGDWPAGQAAAKLARVQWRALGDRAQEALTIYTLGLLARLRGERALARVLFDEGLATARAAAHHVIEGLNLYGRAFVASDEGEYAAARVDANAALDCFQQVGWKRGIGDSLGLLGELSSEAGDYASAQSHLERALELERELIAHWWVARTLTRLGKVAIQRGDLRAAYALLAESIALAWRLGSRERAAHALEAVAHLAAVDGQPARAVRLVGAAAALRQAIGSPLSPRDRAGLEYWLGSARHALGGEEYAVASSEGRAMSVDQAIAYALETVGETGDGRGMEMGRVRSSVMDRAPGQPLTPRERAVVVLVAEGLSNIDIAQRLVISERTVESHVSHALGKLSISSRARLAAWAVEQRL